jgi:hypothetical protein
MIWNLRSYITSFNRPQIDKKEIQNNDLKYKVKIRKMKHKVFMSHFSIPAYFFTFLFIHYYVLGVHCDIYKTFYSIS